MSPLKKFVIAWLIQLVFGLILHFVLEINVEWWEIVLASSMIYIVAFTILTFVFPLKKND
jgi:hypothetical protein